MRHTPRSLILVTIDCLRADHVGFLGYPKQTTPFLDSLAKQSFVFTNAVVSGVPTYYSLPSLLTSRYPFALGRDVIGIAPGENTIATVLKERGFATAAFAAANPYVSAAYGYDSGFDTCRDFLNANGSDFALEGSRGSARPGTRTRANQFLSQMCHRLPLLGAAYDEVYFQYCQRMSCSSSDSLDALRRFPSADVLIDCATAWLHQYSSGPFFLWIHLMDPHAPYFPKLQATAEIAADRLDGERAKYINAYWGRGDLNVVRLQKRKQDIVDLYDSGIRWADLQIKRLVRRVAELGVLDDCAVAVTADHGEQFLEHGGRFHSPLAVHEELVHVPLLLRVPGFSGSRDLSDPIGLIDLAPTLLDALEISTPSSFRGRSCWSHLLNNKRWEWPVITECAFGCNNPTQVNKRSAPRLLAVRKQSYKLVVNFALGIEELFDVHSDPNEVNPLALEAAKEQRKCLLQFAEKHICQSYKSRDLDTRLAAQLRDLRLNWTQATAARVN
ncbi:MAG TPA: sulfatase [Terriglobales bacterium]|nr:sulfatase [Terriglobales bacterium]